MSDTKLNLYQKLLKITEEVGKIEKTGKNSMQNYSFIEQAQVVAALRPQLSAWGVFIIPETVSRTIDRYDVTRSNGKMGVDFHAKVVSRYTVVNADNPDERFVSEWDAGEAIDSSDKATNKATTASHKYFLMKLFNISDKEDADTSSPEIVAVKPASAAQLKMIRDTVMRLYKLDNKEEVDKTIESILTIPITRLPSSKVWGAMKRIEAAAKEDIPAEPDMVVELTDEDLKKIDEGTLLNDLPY